MRRPGVKVLGGLTAVAVLAAGVTAYQVANRGAPSFRRGGDFAASQPTDASPPSSPKKEETSTTMTGARTPTVTVAPTSSTTTAGAAGGTTATPVTQPSTRSTHVLPARPASGIYTYALDGAEEASFFGKRRFPETMTIAVHEAAGLRGEQVVADLRYSDAHEEREILGYRDDGVYLDFAGGSISYGPMTETSEGDFDPPVVQVPKPLAAQTTRSGVAYYRDRGGSVKNTVDWKATILGQETVTVAGADVVTWKVEVESRTRPGPADQIRRERVYWYDPARAWWVKFTETTHGERMVLGGSVTYDATLSATLTGFAPSS